MATTRGGVPVTPTDPAIIAQASGQSQGGFLSRIGNRLLDIWMGPAQPQAPMVPNVPTRDWNFEPGFNFMRTPNAIKHRESGGVDHFQLRALANQTHVRNVIEAVKNEQCKVTWTYVVRAEPGENKGSAKKRTLGDPRIKVISKFFASPDRRHDWSDWLRLLLEEALTIDYPCILHQPWQFGAAREPYLTEVIDGDLIRPYIDVSGREPIPLYSVGADGKVTAPPAFSQWIQSIEAKQFTAPIDRGDPEMVAAMPANANDRLGELMVMRRNPVVKRLYGFSPVEQLLFYINLIMRRDLTKLAYYTEGNIPAGLMPVPPDWQTKQIKEFQDFLDITLTGDPAMRARLIAIPGVSGRGIEWAQKEVLQDTFDDALIRLVCKAFGVSNASFIAHSNKATADTSKTQAEEEGQASYLDYVRRVQNRIIRLWFGWDDIVAISEEEAENDQAKQSKIDDERIKNGSMLINEVRERDGLERLDIEPGIVTATGYFTFGAMAAKEAASVKLAENPPPEPAAFAGNQKPVEKKKIAASY